MQLLRLLNAHCLPVLTTSTHHSVTFSADGHGVGGYQLNEAPGRFPQFQFPIAVMDIGSNYIKALILTPDGVLNVQKFPSPFGAMGSAETSPTTRRYTSCNREH